MPSKPQNTDIAVIGNGLISMKIMIFMPLFPHYSQDVYSNAGKTWENELQLSMSRLIPTETGNKGREKS